MLEDLTMQLNACCAVPGDPASPLVNPLRLYANFCCFATKVIAPNVREFVNGAPEGK
jgi:hypothetical protein